MIKRKTEIDINAFPSELHEFLRSGDIYDSSSSPEAKTLYCDSGYYIKIARSGELALEAMDEYQRYEMGRKTYNFVRSVMRNPEYRAMIQKRAAEIRAQEAAAQCL